MQHRHAQFPLYEKGIISPDSGLLGMKSLFSDIDYSQMDSRSGSVPVLSQMDVEAIMVVNLNASNLEPGQLVKWATDSTYGPGKAVNVVAGDDEHAAGIVSPYLPSVGAAQNEVFWLIVGGPTRVQWDGTNISARGVQLTTDASGQARAYVAGTDEPTNQFGLSLETKTSGSAGDLYRALVHFPLQ